MWWLYRTPYATSWDFKVLPLLCRRMRIFGWLFTEHRTESLLCSAVLVGLLLIDKRREGEKDEMFVVVSIHLWVAEVVEI